VRAPPGPQRSALGALPLLIAEPGPGDEVRVYGRPGLIAALQARGYATSPAPPPAADPAAADALAAALTALAAAHPERARVAVLGHSRGGRPIWGLQIDGSEAPAPAWRVLAAHHGDERSSDALALAVAGRLLDAPLPEPRPEVWVVPHVNPDGVAAGERMNAHGVDLNRNYGWAWSAAAFGAGPAAWSEPETRAVRALADRAGFGGGLSLHSGATNLGWPWNHQLDAPPDAAAFAALASVYASALGEEGFWITQGSHWYITEGDTNDWSYGGHGVLDMTLELSLEKSPPAAEVERLIAAHLPAVDALLGAPHGFGRIVDTRTGRGVPGELAGAGPALQAGPDGRFSRPLPAGAPWSGEVRAPGYAPRIVTLRPGAAVEVRLEPRALGALPGGAAVLGPDGRFTAPGAGPARLTRPGEADVRADPDAAGALQAPPSALRPGPWTVERAGQVYPRALFVPEGPDAPRLRVRAAGPRALTLETSRPCPGAVAWGLEGPDRAPEPLPVAQRGAALAVALPHGDGPLDLWVLACGANHGVLDARGAPRVAGADPSGDPGPPPGTAAAGRRRTGYGDGCATAAGAGQPQGQRPTDLPGSPHGTLRAAPVTLLLALLARRRPRRPAPCAPAPPPR